MCWACCEEIQRGGIGRIPNTVHPAKQRSGSIATFDPESYFKQAGEADVRRKAGSSKSLDGVPLILKDNIDTKDLPTTGGTGALAGEAPQKMPPPLLR